MDAFYEDLLKRPSDASRPVAFGADEHSLHLRRIANRSDHCTRHGDFHDGIFLAARGYPVGDSTESASSY